MTMTPEERAREIRARHLLNVSLATAGGDPGDLKLACDLAEQAITSALLAEREAATPQWRSIDSAPNDNTTWFCAYRPSAKGTVGAWDRFVVTRRPDLRRLEPRGAFTHWMPLPTPPTDAGGGEG